jgi:hypothetical protein
MNINLIFLHDTNIFIFCGQWNIVVHANIQNNEHLHEKNYIN